MKTINIPNYLHSHFIGLIDVAVTFIEARKRNLTVTEILTVKFAKKLIKKYDKEICK